MRPMLLSCKMLVTSLVTLLLTLLPRPSLQAQTQLSGEARAALTYFLQVDCEVDTRGQALSSMLKFQEVVPALVQVLQKGPDDDTLRENDRLLEEQWHSREQYLKGNPSLGLTDQQLQMARQITKESYLKMGREQLVRKYRQKAVAGLAAFDTPDARKALQAAVNDQDESVRAAIKAAQARYREKESGRRRP